MSVINQMLRDLDERQASEQERAGLPPRLRPLPPAAVRRAPQSLRMLVLGMGIGALAAGGAVAFLMAPVAAPPPPPPPAAAPAPAAVPPAPTLARPADASSADLGEMKLSTLLALAKSMSEAPAPPPAEAAAPQASPKPTAPPPAKPAAVQEKPAPAPAPRAAKVPAAPAPVAAPAADAGEDARIDKRARGGQAREMAEAEYRKGMQAVRGGDSATALPLLRRALELDPSLNAARQALLSVLVGARQWQEARLAAQNGLALDPAQSGWAIILARLQFEQNDAAGALATLEKHAAHAGTDADYQGLFAYLLQRQQRPAEAAERFRAALALRPGEGRWWFGLGLALEDSGQPAEAKEAYAKAKEIGSLPADMTAVIEQKLR